MIRDYQELFLRLTDGEPVWAGLVMKERTRRTEAGRRIRVEKAILMTARAVKLENGDVLERQSDGSRWTIVGSRQEAPERSGLDMAWTEAEKTDRWGYGTEWE